MVTAWSPHGHRMVTSWSPRGHLMVTSWSPRAPSWSPRGHLVVTSWSPRAPSWSPRGRPECLSVVIYQRMRQRFDPYKLGDCASLCHIYGDPPPLIGFFGECAGPLWGDSGEVTRIYTSRDIGPQNSPEYTPSSPRVHLQSTTGSATVAAAGATTG